MEWYVLNYDFNEAKAYNFNIFNSSRLIDGLKRKFDDNLDANREEFKKEVDSLLRYCFWCKCEYEIYVIDAFHDENKDYTKIDVYTQLKPNLDILVDYILKNKETIIDNY